MQLYDIGICALRSASSRFALGSTSMTLCSGWIRTSMAQ